MRPRPGAMAALLLFALLAGCNGPEVRGAVVLDDELRSDGAWTDRDARARALLDLAAPPEQAGKWPVRLAPARRKLLTEIEDLGVPLVIPRIGVELVRPDWEQVTVEDVGAVLGILGQDRASLGDTADAFLSAWTGTFSTGVLDTLFGQDHEPRYTYVAVVDAWVLLARDGSPCVIADDAGEDVVLPWERTPDEVFPILRRELERDLARLAATIVTDAAPPHAEVVAPGARPARRDGAGEASATDGDADDS